MTQFRIASTNKITHIAQALASIPWPTPEGIVDSLVAELGWTRLPSESRIDVRTDLDLANQRTTFLCKDGLVLEIDVFLSDLVRDDDALEPVRNAFKELLPLLVRVLGRQSGRRGPNVWWDLEAGCRLHLKGDNVVKFQWLSKRYADIERGEARHEISPDRVLGEDE